MGTSVSQKGGDYKKNLTKTPKHKEVIDVSYNPCYDSVMPYKTGSWGEQAKERSIRRKQYFFDYAKQWQKKNHKVWLYRERSRQKLRRAILAGKINKGICEICGKSDTQAHHGNYEKPFEVNWLCKIHHRAVHFGGLDLEMRDGKQK